MFEEDDNSNSESEEQVKKEVERVRNIKRREGEQSCNIEKITIAEMTRLM